MSDPFRPPERSWPRKFRDAFRGLWIGIAVEKSFRVHLLLTALVLIAATVLRLDLTRWCLLLLCIALVGTAELLNTGLERLAKAVDTRHNQHLADALDIGSGAVLLAAIGASLVGAVIFVERLFELLVR